MKAWCEASKALNFCIVFGTPLFSAPFATVLKLQADKIADYLVYADISQLWSYVKPYT